MHLAKRDGSTELLSAHRLFRTRDIDRARHTVSQKFCAHKLEPGSTHRSFDTLHNHAPGISVSLNYLRYGCDIAIDPGELGSFYLVQVPIAGTALIRNGNQWVDASPHTASVLNPTRATQMQWSGGCEKFLLQIDREALRRTAESMTGQSLDHAVVFDPQIDLRTAAMKGWTARLRTAIMLAETALAFGKNFHRHQLLLEEELISGFLTAQRSSISHMLEDAQAAPSAGALRRAHSFICERIGEPITIREVSKAAGCSARSLQIGFQQHFGCSPMRYLKRQRLNYAHHLLQTQPADTLISSIAYDAGFSHLGRFAEEYRSKFGQSPSQTQNRGGIA